MPRYAFVATATATATGLIVDLARMPVYAVTVGDQIVRIWPIVLVATIGVVIGTLFGGRILRRIPEARFRSVIAILLAMLGLAMLLQGLRATTGDPQ